jgi:hypothetical protein
MAKIWNDIEIDLDGETYTVRPTIEFLNHLEQGQGRSLSQLFYRMSKGDLPSGIAAEIIAKTLNYAGAQELEKARPNKTKAKFAATITAEEIFEKTGGGLGQVTINLVQTILLACMPTPKEEQPVKKAPARTQTTRKRKQTGKNSTA